MNNNKNKIIFTAEKESFVARVLIKKVNDIGVLCDFVPFNIDALNKALGDAALIAIYLDDDTKINDDIAHFLSDKMRERDGYFMLIGDQAYINTMSKKLPEPMIYETYPRPVNNDEFAQSVKRFFDTERREQAKKRILIVDDDPQYLNLVREWLKDTYKVSMANSGLQAIKLLGKNTVDLILLDYEMPITTGPQVLEMLRADDDTKSIPVMFLTSKDDKESVMEVVALRPEAYFLKSITKDELLLKLKDYFLEH